MSLIYNALREQAPALPVRLPLQRALRPGALLLAVLVAVPTGYAGVRLVAPAVNQAIPAGLPDSAGARAAIRQPAPSPASAGTPSYPAPVRPAAVVSAPAHPRPLATNTVPAAPVAAVAPAPRRPAASLAAQADGSVPAVPRTAMRPAGQLQVSQRQADSDAIAPLQAQMQQAIAEGQFENAQDLLDRLGAQLPADSLTLLRAQAWLAHARGDQPMALQAYRRIVDRVPDDAHAGANLALLLAASGQPEQAHALLARLSLQQADNPLLRRARAALETSAP